MERATSVAGSGFYADFPFQSSPLSTSLRKIFVTLCRAALMVDDRLGSISRAGVIHFGGNYPRLLDSLRNDRGEEVLFFLGELPCECLDFCVVALEVPPLSSSLKSKSSGSVRKTFAGGPSCGEYLDCLHAIAAHADFAVLTSISSR